MSEKKKTRYINPPNILKQKVGGGGIPKKLLSKGQEAISNNNVDFAPYAENFLKQLNATMESHAAGKLKDSEAIDKLSEHVMQLKANGGMFGYDLISSISDIVLLLLDNIESLNEDAIKILQALQNSLEIIIASRLKGHGGREGEMLEDELHGACKRFYKKYSIKPE